MTDITALSSPVRQKSRADRRIRVIERRGDRIGDLLPPLAERFRPDDFAPPRVNLRWLIGAVLTAFAGAGLIGSAVLYSLERSDTLVEQPDLVASGENTDDTSSGITLTKGDRLVIADLGSARQIFKTSIPITVGEREIIRSRPYVRVSTNLALAPMGYANDVPTFDPLKIFAGSDETPAPQLETRISESESDLALRKRPITDIKLIQNDPFTLNDDQIEVQVEEARKAAFNLGRAMPVTFGGQQFLTRSLPQSIVGPSSPAIDTAFSSIQISVVPENVTDIMKKPPVQTAPRATTDERMLTIRRGEKIEQILVNNRVAQSTAREVTTLIAQQMKDTPIKEGQKLRILLALPSNPKSDPQLLRVMLYDADQILAIAAINDRGSFVAVAPPSTEGTIGADEQPDGEAEDQSGFRLYDSLYETALKNEIPKPIIDQLIKIYFYDVDLQRKVAGGDSFEVFYAEEEDNPGRFEVLYAALSVAGITKRYYQYRSPTDSSIDYFDESGKSNRKFLMRKPITEGIFRSGFGMRYHPILKVARLHSGVDWANKVGTPILAAGDGTITWADWDTGYGRHIEIQHAYDFVTTYSHLSAFATGIAEGVHVRQGQVIGYLGSSGLSTGPHLHYEVLVKGEFKDPMAIKLPRNRELDDKELKAFKLQQEGIKEILAKAPGAIRTLTTTTQN